MQGLQEGGRLVQIKTTVGHGTKGRRTAAKIGGMTPKRMRCGNEGV